MRAVPTDAQPATGSGACTCEGKRTRPDVLILGLGSPIMSDDAVGLHVARELRQRIAPEAADVDEASTSGLRLLDVIRGYERLIVIDAILTGTAPPGTLHRVPLDAVRGTQRLTWQHGIDFGTTLQLGQRLGMRVPAQVSVYGVEVRDPYCFGERLSPELEAVVPCLADTIAREMFPGPNGGATS